MDSKKDKSVLDGIPVKETGPVPQASKQLVGIVGHCPQCGCPIYGPTLIETAPQQSSNIPVKRTCCCPTQGNTGFRTT